MDPKMLKQFKGLSVNPDGGSKKQNCQAQTTPRPLRLSMKEAVISHNFIKIRMNHFPVVFTANFPEMMYHYDVVIDNAVDLSNVAKKPVTPKAKEDKEDEAVSSLPDRMLPAIWKRFEQEFKSMIGVAACFDGKKNVYTAKLMLFPEQQKGFMASFKMEDPDDPDKMRHFSVWIKLVKEVSTAPIAEFLKSGQEWGKAVVQPQDVIQGLDVALRHSPSTHYITCSRSFFNETTTRHRLNQQLDLMYGHYQSLCFGSEESKTLNIDLATKAFFKEMSVADFIKTVLRMRQNDNSFEITKWAEKDFKLVSDALKGKLIKYGTGKFNPMTREYEKYHKFSAVGMIKDTAAGYTFEMTSGEKKTRTTVAQYMKTYKNTIIRNPDFPLVHIGNQNMTNYVPLELCTILTQPYKGKMETALTSEMIKGAAKAPVERFDKIMESLAGCEFDDCKVLKEFGIKIGEEPIEQQAYLLKPPAVNIMSKGKIEPTSSMNLKEGKWGFNGGQFVKGAVVPKYMMLDTTFTTVQDPNKPNNLEEKTLTEFIQMLARMGEKLGMKEFVKPRDSKVTCFPLSKWGDVERDMAGALERAFVQIKSKDFKVVIVIISDDGKEYATVKVMAEVKVGILTACIKRKNVNTLKPQTLTNFLLKLNSKLNGINFDVKTLLDDYLKVPTMILGADVTHPSPNSKSPSIAAVTASFNMSAMGYSMHIQPQKSKQELITNMGEILDKMIAKFHETNKSWPKRIIMFRDGVSEGFFDEVKAVEFEDMKKAAENICKSVKIQFAFVVVKKRHHTRFQPLEITKAVGKKFFNVPPGTVVDSKIVHPSEIEFFLNSHVGIQGTSKPTRYHVIHDDIGLSMADLTKITYYLCYGFVRCTQPVSYPSATYYAHLAAYRARSLLEKEGENASLEKLIEQLTIHPDLLEQYPMFFV